MLFTNQTLSPYGRFETYLSKQSLHIKLTLSITTSLNV
ncbi:predicted protein [Plenodomus lingam JN3]|uniref:Predicted protein n=1 Tax=Leptosphaeria maculans (strain JN3 / isolate v23.1.3 / race Av1-4-5-6-7-8) TaxID=985895 RepID=E4ZRX6_LEPMJ|nr:predicted protein [Plenodomus lingam JN3]CBX90014.1 predicted protein [Plenodomus lingam JN3]